MDKRYQVFVSSTFSDLMEERRAVIQSLMELSCIPAGMELFPASDEAQFEYIKRIIEDCDYYLLIIGGRYGSLTAEGISFTEKEYDYALEIGLKVVALLHESPEDLPFKKSEAEPALRQRLNAFREKVKTGRLVRHWRTATDLQTTVVMSMLNTIRQFPAVGWVKANRMPSEELLTEINELRKEKEALEKRLASIQPQNLPSFENLAGLDETYRVAGTVWRPRSGNSPSPVTVTWRRIFELIAPYIVNPTNESIIESVLEKGLWTKERGALDNQSLKTIGIQLQAHGLVRIAKLKTVSGGSALFWTATAAGEKLGLELRVVRSDKPSS